MEYTERLEGPDGQFCVLLTRLPYERALLVERESIRESNLSVFANACLRAHLWEASVTDYLTGEDAGDDFMRGAPEVITPWRERAVQLYVEWRKIAFPGPKGSPRTGRRTRSGDRAPSATTAPPPSVAA